MNDRLRREYAETLKQSYLKSGFKQGFEAGYTKAKEDFGRPHGEWETKTITNERTGEKEIYSFCPCCGASYLKEGEAE